MKHCFVKSINPAKMVIVVFIYDELFDIRFEEPDEKSGD